MPSVLFVCTANICRSPMAMGLFKAKLRGDESNWRVESAGTWALEGSPPATYTSTIVAQHGIDISRHRAKTINDEIIDQFDLILTMEQNHKEALLIEFPGSRGRVYLISEMIEESYNIRDPVGGSIYEFQDTAREIEFILENGFEKIKDLAEKRVVD